MVITKKSFNDGGDNVQNDNKMDEPTLAKTFIRTNYRLFVSQMTADPGGKSFRFLLFSCFCETLHFSVVQFSYNLCFLLCLNLEYHTLKLNSNYEVSTVNMSYFLAVLFPTFNFDLKKFPIETVMVEKIKIGVNKIKQTLT